MRLRHKKGAETDILTHPFIIQTSAAADKLCGSSMVFQNNHPIHLELGMGKGKFITEMSERYPDINFIGIEKSATIVLKAIDNLIARENACAPELLLTAYPNLRFMCLDIENLDKIFLENSIDKIYLNFSDPWPKKRHESRRLTHHKFLSIYEKLLKANSIIEFKTDNKNLFDFSLDQIINSNFDLSEFTYDLHNDAKLNEGNIMTEYEAKFSKLGNKICKLIAKVK